MVPGDMGMGLFDHTGEGGGVESHYGRKCMERRMADGDIVEEV